MSIKSKRIATCNYCSNTFTHGVQSTGTYCSTRCSGDAKRAESQRRFEVGLVTKRTTAKSFVVERDGYSCRECGIFDYNGKEISLQLDHIDGCAANNMPDNLRLLCPNCHSQTPHYGAKNKGKGRKSLGLPTF